MSALYRVLTGLATPRRTSQRGACGLQAANLTHLRGQLVLVARRWLGGGGLLPSAPEQEGLGYEALVDGDGLDFREVLERIPVAGVVGIARLHGLHRLTLAHRAVDIPAIKTSRPTKTVNTTVATPARTRLMVRALRS